MASINEEQIRKERFPVSGMTCAACASSIESVLRQSDGVLKAEVNFATKDLWVEYQPQLDAQDLKKTLQAVGYDLILASEDQEEEKDKAQENYYESLKKRTAWSIALSVPVFIASMFFSTWSYTPWLSLALSVPVLFYFGAAFYQRAWKQLKHGRANMDTLVALSTGMAFLFSLGATFFPQLWTNQGLEAHLYYEAAMVIISFVSIGKLLEERANSQTSSALKKLMGLQAKQVSVIRNGEEAYLDIKDLIVGDLILVKPGEKIPVDGMVKAGSSYVDESMISGEPVPILKEKRATVYSGTSNQKGSLKIIAQKLGGETLLAQIIKRVQEAQGSKAPIQKMVDKIAAVFVPVVLLIALLTFGLWYFSGIENALAYGLVNAISVLVIACPCALGLATPTAVMVGIGRAAELNMLIKNAESLEIAKKVKHLVLDKTGTITQGKARISDLKIFGETQDKLSYLLAMEAQSDHPLAQAVLLHLKEKGLKAATIQNLENQAGKGLRAEDDQGNHYFVGNESLLLENGIKLNAEQESLYKQWQSEAKSLVFFADQQKVLALLALEDSLKEDSLAAIQELQRMGLELHLMSGDNAGTVKHIAEKVGIKNYRGGQMPQDKSYYIKQLQAQGKTVAMVGDGINDAEALAQADLSIAMGHGSDIAIDVAQITISNSNLKTLPKAFRLSQKTIRTIKQNLFWAFIYNVVGIPLAAGLLYPNFGFLLNPMLAGAAMAFSSVSVVSNSLRLKNTKI
ncbi:MAG: copper-translocating P-type ATPase [Bacteroidetes bacterium]|nr:MAG: copper-translocating P-type ATPase [Bacteroidota bacterium]